MKQQYNDKTGASIAYSAFKFKDTPDSDDPYAEPLLKLIHPGDCDSYKTALEPVKGRVSHHFCPNSSFIVLMNTILQIRASAIDFWMNSFDIEALKLKHTHLLYPPRIKMTLVLRESDVIVPVFFRGCTEDSEIDVELSLTGKLKDKSYDYKINIMRSCIDINFCRYSIPDSYVTIN